MLCRCILPDWAKAKYPELPKVVEADLTEDQQKAYNEKFYNIYFLPNYPSSYTPNVTVDGSHIDTFGFVFADMDLKDGIYADKDEFVKIVLEAGLEPTYIVDSGNGVHVYWNVTDLDAMSFLRLQRRMLRKFNTDEAVAKIYQLMRVPGTVNTKYEDNFKLAEMIYQSEKSYTSEELDRFLPPLSLEDEEYCKTHYEKTYSIENKDKKVDDTLPQKFGKLIKENKEVKEIWSGNTDDRSKADYRLGHILFANGFTKAEAASVLVNTAKALARAPVHRIGYAEGIIDKIWTYELAEDKNSLTLSKSVKDILSKGEAGLKGTKFPCNRYLDATYEGFRLGQVIGLVAGSGVGKTAMALNMFQGFVERNPEYDHLFVPLEQPAREIADRWRTMCGDNTGLHEKVQVMSNYEEDGSFRRLSLGEIKDYILKYQKITGRKIGCVVIDHIGALKKKTAAGENQDIMDICHEMKAFAIQTDTLLVMQSQSSREKAGIGDLELNKDAAYGTVYFESYCDYLITIWQPLKRCYKEEGCPAVTAFKFCKIRHKKMGLDDIQEDVRYLLYFDSSTEIMRELTQDEEKSFDFFNKKATNLRKQDRKTDIISYDSMSWMKQGATDGTANNNQDSNGA